MYTIKKVRKLLGKETDGISDEKLQKEIDAATLLKDLFFDNLIRKRKKE